ncbi:MAG: MFS transporter [Chloroflexota bacterium]
MTHSDASPTNLATKLQAYLQRSLSSLSIPAYRWLWFSILFGSMRLINVFIARGWLVLAMTDSPFWVGAAVAMRGVTQILFGAFSGVLLDRVNRRLILGLAEISTALTAFTIGLLVYFDQVTLWHILAASFLEGMFVSVRWPAINTIILGIVGPERLLNASAGQFLAFNVGNVTASAFAGLLIEGSGIHTAYFVATLFGLIGATCVFFVREKFETKQDQEPFMQALQGGIRYIWHHKGLVQLVAISFVMSFFGWAHISMMPVMARDVLLVDATGLGYLTAAGATGALISTTIIAGLGDYQGKRRLVVYMGMFTAAMLIFFAISRSFELSLLLKSLIHAGLMAFETGAMTLVLLLTDDKMQGRVQGIYTLVFGFTWLGGLAMGSLASISSAPVAIGLGGSIILLILIWLRRPILRLPIE